MPGMPDGVVDFMVGMTDRLHQGWVVDHSSIEGLYEDYAVPNLAVHHATKEHGIPVTFWRSVGHSYTAFAKEVTMDALAEAAGQDPVAFRLAHLEHNPRLAAVVAKAQEAWKGWTPAPGRHLGFAAHHSFATWPKWLKYPWKMAPFAFTACSAPWTAASPSTRTSCGPRWKGRSCTA